MKPLKKTFILLLLMATGVAYSQTFTVPKNYKLKKEEDYAKYEKDIIACATWLEETPIDEDEAKRASASVFLIDWIEGAPNVTISLDSKIVNFNEKNKDLLIIFMAGWTKYALENPTDKSEVNGCVAGLKSVAAFYKKNEKNLKKDKNVIALQQRIDDGTLEAWVKKQMGK